MSIGLAIANIAISQSKVEAKQVEIADLEQQLETLGVDAQTAALAGQPINPAATMGIRAQIAAAKFLYNVYKGAHEFWSMTLKDFLAFLKQTNELAQGAR